MTENNCPFCGKKYSKFDREPLRDCFHIECKRCGKYSITGSCLAGSVTERRAEISGVLRWRTERNANTILITTESISGILNGADIPRKVPDKIDKIVTYIGKKSNAFGQYIDIDRDNDYSLTFSPSAQELSDILKYLMSEKLFEGRSKSAASSIFEYRLTMTGWRHFYDLEKINVNARLCFVAMNFSPNYDFAYEKIAEALATCGYEAYRVKGEQTNDDVTNLIISGIKKSKFVVAELSGERPSAYYEAGYAKGIGKEVIWVCKKGETLHFDTRQFSHILWEEENDLKKQLIDRVNATII